MNNNFKNEVNKEEQEKLSLAFFSKYQKMRNEYIAVPSKRDFAGILILNEGCHNNNYQISAMQFGSPESVFNTLLIGMLKTLESYDADTQVRALYQLSETFAIRAQKILDMNN